jgi:anti-anti-sigma factor
VSRFNAYLSPVEGGSHIKLVGEFDLTSRPLADEVLESVQDSRKIVIDLSDLEFIDSTGIHFLVIANEHARERGCEFTIVRGAAPAVSRVFHTVGLDQALPFVDPGPLSTAA